MRYSIGGFRNLVEVVKKYCRPGSAISFNYHSKETQSYVLIVVLVNRELSDGPVNWSHVSRRNLQNSQ